MRHTHARRPFAIAILVVVAACAVVVGAVAVQSASSSAVVQALTPGLSSPPLVEADGQVTAADGTLPSGGASVDDAYPGVANIDADLLAALREAATDASARGIRISITSGWRSAEYQAGLLRDAVSTYGSEAEAARWVATPTTSLHVAGDAVDIGSYDAMDWLAENGAAYGLCRVYENEPWHFELHDDAGSAGCPPTYRDATQDPRLRS